MFGASDERFHVRGGNDLIPTRLGAKLADAIESGHVLESLRGSDGDYTLSFRRGAASTQVQARQVILALPFTLLRKVELAVDLPPVKRRAIDTLAYGTNAKLMIGYDRRVWREHDANGASMSDLSYQTTWDTTRKQPGTGGVLTNFTGGRHGVELGQGTPRQQADRATADLERAVPRHRRGACRRARSPLPLALASVVAGQLRLPASRRLDRHPRRDGRIGRRPAFRRRALRTGYPGLHGRRLRIRRNRGARGAGAARHGDACGHPLAASRGLSRRCGCRLPGRHRPRQAAFLNQPVLFCSAACIPDNDSFTIGTHPDVGEGAGPYPVRRCGLFIWRGPLPGARLRGVPQGTHARIVAMNDPADAHASRQLARLSAVPQLASLADDAALRGKLQRIAVASDFAIDTLLRQPSLLAHLAVDDGAAMLPPPQLTADNRSEWPSLLRRFRSAASTRLIWRDVLGLDDVDATLAGSTRLAEICLQSALAALEAEFVQRFGTVRATDGTAQRLVVFGLGKLGGGELNFSSDVDLVYAYPQDGESDGPRALAAEDYFARLGQQLAKLLDEATADGFCHRVDLRLRPFGNAGRVALPFAAMESYFQREGRDWERYAWQKARPVAGDSEAGERFLQTLRPFVYRRYLDYGALDGLREMKAAIAAEVARKELADDIKRGPGGIREIEFLVQALQLIRGGREPLLRERRLLPALQALVDAGHIAADTGVALAGAYRFLRRLENRLQMLRDAQTHALPEDAAGSHAPRARTRLSGLGLRCATRSMNSARRVTAEFEACWRRAGARAPPATWPRTGARCRMRATRTRSPPRASTTARISTAACATSPARPACAHCRMRPARAWIACCRHCSKRPRGLRNPMPRCADCCRCCIRCCAAPATSPCSTSSPARSPAWPTCSDAARCWPNASARIRCCSTNCSTCAWPARCRIARHSRPNARRRCTRTMSKRRCTPSTNSARR